MTTKTTARNAASEATQAGADTAKKTAETAADTAKRTAQTAADTTKKTAETTAETAADTTKKTAETVADTATEVTTDLAAEGQRNLTEKLEKFSKGLEGFTSFSQDNVEAVVKSSEIAAKAFEGISSEISAYSKKSFDDVVAAAQDFASARTASELFEKQAAYAQNAFEDWLHQTSKMNEILAAAAKDISAPIGERLSAASDAVKSFSL